ncbi:metallophosphatase [Marinobacterium zhoushanense]|uniref:Metallophosphatase n=1 Tax=Marinobacterium zhoushanense TaxID=1679163 RepID=A0ABQ1KN00_9GAMM|nr:alkaline phosphatase D family protein [Marinobacterium zhoushanense]GGC01875.1 metallophosphatase [Marinobacterium zhoushanense]
MSAQLILGPLLGLESDTLYTVCLVTSSNVEQVVLRLRPDSGRTETVTAMMVEDNEAGRFWRAEKSLDTPEQGEFIAYQLLVDDTALSDPFGHQHWTFYQPGREEKPKLAYASCNGFSDEALRTSTSSPYRMWHEMAKAHDQEPFSLLMMGGDQVYADSIWSRVKTLADWHEQDLETRMATEPDDLMRSQISEFYANLYVERWRQDAVARMMASIPSVMMWDDHDIFDGWGSYPEDLQNCPVFHAIYDGAARFFRLYQLRNAPQNRSLLAPERGHHAFGFRFRRYHILALDNRAERAIKQVMSRQQWEDLLAWLDQRDSNGDLLVLSAVPVVYRDFSQVEAYFDMTSKMEELTDDLKDHWRAKTHEGERARLIMRLLANARKRQAGRTLILSGDVHIGCLGVIRDRQHQTLIHQVVSSGIVHPAPSRIQWIGISAVTNDDTEYPSEDEQIAIDMLRPHGADKYLRTRNFATLQEGTDRKLWINWICENGEAPCYPLQ